MNAKVNPQLKSEGKLFLDGEHCLSAKGINIKATLNNSTSKCLGDKSPSHRNVSYDLASTVTRYKVEPFGKKVILNYIEKGITPEFTIQAMNNDAGSDFFKQFGDDTVTVTGAVLSGDLSLIDLDASSTDYVEETLNFVGGKLT